jgi:hypothetical protein
MLRKFSELVLILVCTVVVLAARPLTASAQQAPKTEDEDPKAASRRLKQEADALMVERQYTEALRKYDQAYAEDPNPALLYNRARAYESLGKFHLALEQLERFSAEAPAELKARVPKLRELLDEIRARVTTLTVTSNVEGARVLINNELIGTTPIRDKRVPSGETAIQLFMDGFAPRERRVSLPGGASFEVEIVLASKQQRMGILTITTPSAAPVAGAEAFVDGKAVGELPTEALLGAGAHKLMVKHPSYEDYEAQVVIQAGITKQHVVELEQIAPVYEQWWLWTIVGGVVIGGAVAGIVYAAVTERPADKGDIEPGQVSAPIVGGKPALGNGVNANGMLGNGVMLTVPVVRW